MPSLRERREKSGRSAPKKDEFTSRAEPADKSFKDQALRAGGGALLGALKVLDAPRAAVDKLNELGPRTKVAGVDVSAGNALVPIAGQMALLSKLRDDSPKGVAGFARNVAVDIAQDPLTYVTFGAGGAAKAGLKQIGESLGKQVADDVVKQGAKRVLSQPMRQQVLADLAARGVKPKQAQKLLTQVDRAGQGGVKVLGRTIVPESKIPLMGSASRAARGAARGGRLRTAAAAVTPRAGISLDLGRDAADEVGSAAARSRAFAQRATADTVESFAKAMKAAKVTRSELRDVVLPALDIGQDAVTVPARLRPLVETLRADREVLQNELMRNGLLDTVRELETYVPLKMTRAGRKAMEVDPATTERVGGFSPQWTTSSAAGAQGGHLKARDVMPDASIREVEDVLGGALRQSGALAEGKALTVQDPARLFAERAAQGHRALAYKRFVDELASTDVPGVGKLLVPASSGAQRPAGWVEVSLGQFGDFFAPKAVAKEVDQVRDTVVNDKSIREFQQLLERSNAWWKSMATIGSIISGGGFFARNAIGNVWNNFLGGVKDPRDYARAADLMATVRRGGVGALGAEDRRVWEAAVREGVLGSGFYASEVTRPFNSAADFAGTLGRAVTPESAAERAAKAGRAANVFSRESVPLRAGSALSGTIEDHARLSHFVAKMRQHGNAEEAARSVRKYLFDYQDLTAMDRHIKHAAAFWTWTRKNTALQLQSVLSQPGKFTGYAHVMLNAAAAAEPGDYPKWAVESGLVPVSEDLMVGVDAPPGAAAEALDPSAKNVVGLLGGFGGSLLKTAFEQATGHSAFSGSKVDTSAGGTATRTAEAAVPLLGRIKRSPYVAELTDDPQAEARRLSAIGLQARNIGEADKAGGSGGKSLRERREARRR